MRPGGGFCARGTWLEGPKPLMIRIQLVEMMFGKEITLGERPAGCAGECSILA